ncbi:MAG: DUF1824 family protein [Thermosynechococcaceae cyanobacterium MS004]|nr:DUF1824 family protein [Thermosynechococcaceae cyanobacterium MS004]
MTAQTITQTTAQNLRNYEDLGAGATAEQRETIRQALHELAQAADYQIFGFCAENQATAIAALSQYAQHFSYKLSDTLIAEIPSLEGAVYLKFNPRTQRCFADVYTGTYRGALVSFQSDFSEGYSGTHGHFPLDLYEGFEHQ